MCSVLKGQTIHFFKQSFINLNHSIQRFTTKPMPSIRNAAVIFNEIPSHDLVPDRHIKYVTDRTIDLDTVQHEGGIITKNLVISIDPYMRGRMRAADKKSYSPPFELNQPLTNFFVGKVIKSDNNRFAIGKYVYGFGAYEEYTIHSQQQTQALHILTDDQLKLGLPLTTWVGAAGMPGQTAFYGLYHIGQPKKDETIFITGASGAVGQIVGQLGKFLSPSFPSQLEKIDSDYCSKERRIESDWISGIR